MQLKMLVSKLSKIAVMTKKMKTTMRKARKRKILIHQKRNKRLPHPLNPNNKPPQKIKKTLKKKRKRKRRSLS